MEIDCLELSQQNTTHELSIPVKDNVQSSTILQMQDSPNSNQSSLGFRVGTLGFLINTHIHCEIVDQHKLSPLPNVQPWLSGVLNLRGNIVPVIDLHILLEEKPINSKNRHLLTVDKGRKTVAFWIDGYPQIFDHSLQTANHRLANPPKLLTPIITEHYIEDKQIWLDISLDKLLKSLTYHNIQSGL